MEVDKSDNLITFDFGENFTFGSNNSFDQNIANSYSYVTSIRIVMLSVLLAAAVVGNSLAFHKLVTNRSQNSLHFQIHNTWCTNIFVSFFLCPNLPKQTKRSSIIYFSCAHLDVGRREVENNFQHGLQSLIGSNLIFAFYFGAEKLKV